MIKGTAGARDPLYNTFFSCRQSSRERMVCKRSMQEFPDTLELLLIPDVCDVVAYNCFMHAAKVRCRSRFNLRHSSHNLLPDPADGFAGNA